MLNFLKYGFVFFVSAFLLGEVFFSTVDYSYNYGYLAFCLVVSCVLGVYAFVSNHREYANVLFILPCLLSLNASVRSMRYA